MELLLLIMGGEGDPLEDVEQFIKDLENRITLLEQSYGLVAGCEGIIIKTGTKVYTASGTSDVIFTLAEVYEILGFETPAINCMVTVMNGDGAANSAHFQSCTYLNGTFNVVYPSSQNNIRSRLNWCIIYSPNYINLS